MRIRNWQTIVLQSVLCAALIPVASAADRVGNFGLIDAAGDFHQLSKYGYQNALVIVAQVNGCELNYNQNHKYKLLETTYKDRGVSFVMLNASDERNAVKSEAQAFDYAWPIMMDDTQLVAESLGISKAGEVVVLNPSRSEILYRGPIDTQGRGDEPSTTHLSDSIEKAIAGDSRTLRTTVIAADGCDIEFSSREMHSSNVPDYTNDVAPILAEKCANCHREGGIAPFAMNSHQMVQGWSPMIKETLMTKRMPPAQVDPQVNHFSNARYMEINELQTLVHWIDAGAPRGNSESDPLSQLQFREGWQLGEPDHIVYSERFTVPATGVVDYRFPVIDLPFKEDKWVRAVQFMPSERQVVHHMIARIVEPGFDRTKAASERGEARFLEGFAPGKDDATQFPEGTGVFIPVGHKIEISEHYTTMGREVTDETAIGLYFSNEEPEHEFRTYSLSHGGANLNIPAGARDHRMYASYVFDDDVMVHAFRPHMHTRGKNMKFKVIYPDNSSEDLINVPNYNFAWQPTYRLTEPKMLPAGSRVVVDGALDNSELNPGAADPSVAALGGLQTWEEMFIGYFTYHNVNEI